MSNSTESPNNLYEIMIYHGAFQGFRTIGLVANVQYENSKDRCYPKDDTINKCNTGGGKLDLNENGLKFSLIVLY